MENYGGGLHALCKTGMVQWVYHFFEHSDKEDPQHISKSEAAPFDTESVE